jgi:hypothetical protein
MEFDLRPQTTGVWVDYDGDEDSPPETRVQFLIVRQTTEIKGKAAEEAMQTLQINGNFRRQATSTKMRPGVYQQSIFRQCCQGWKNISDVQPPRGTGEPILYNDETLRAMSLEFDGAVQFVNDYSEMLSRMTVERIEAERARFRGTVPLQGGSSQPGLPSVPEAL